MKAIANLFFEVRMLKDLVRSGYAFLGSGKESIAEHSFMTAFICFAMAGMDPAVDREKLIVMALVHDLAEARTGDFNYVQKNYSVTDESRAISHLTHNLPFGAKNSEIADLIEEFNEGLSREAKLANDADQLSFILELKKLDDTGAKGPDRWLPIVTSRLQTDLGKSLAQSILETPWDEWWTDGYSE